VLHKSLLTYLPLQADCAGWEPQHHFWRRVHSLPPFISQGCGEVQSHRAGQLGRIFRACKEAPSAGSAPLPATSTGATGEQAATGGRQLGSSEGRATYTAVVAAPSAPHKPSGQLKPTAKGLDPSEPTVSSETAPGRMSTDMSGPLSGMPVGTTFDAHVANPCLPAGEHPNKTPIFITGVGDTRAFLAWLRSSCPRDLTAQLKAKKLMVISSTADGFRATVGALRPLDRRKGVSFHTFSLLEDRCVQLLVKNLCKGMPESVVREELESLDTNVQGLQLLLPRPGSCQGLSSHPPLHCVCGTRSGGGHSALSHRALRTAGHGGVVRGAKGPTPMQALPALRPYAEELRIRSSVCHVWGLSPLWWLPGPAGTASVLQL